MNFCYIFQFKVIRFPIFLDLEAYCLDPYNMVTSYIEGYTSRLWGHVEFFAVLKCAPNGYWR